MIYLIAFSVAVLLSGAITPIVRNYALKHRIMAMPDERKIHLSPIPYLGGVAIFVGFAVPAMIFLPLNRRFIALLAGIAILVAVGVIDDIKNLNPFHKLVWQLLAALVVLAGGIGIVSINNPLGGTVNLSAWRYAVNLNGWHFHIAPLANSLSILWMIGLVNAINFLDGLDGLACGVSAIAGLVMFMLSIGPKVNQPEVALLAIIMTGAAIGFLPYNFFPAKIFMGDGGAYFLGLTLALLAIYSGGKLATATLVLGFTIFDSVWAVVRRLYRRTSPFRPDRGHLHHLLLEAGFSQRRAVLTLYALALLFGTVAVFSGSFAKLVSMVALFIILSAATAYLTTLSWRKTKI